ncbi:DNA-directed RNA polymerase, mitochondrial [Tetranychus urticae]|uniref:DNA-directed RNA polymerase n=1 Tax=Tetranychus urticae TaxID=32264 RepID=T1KXQ7_TETUR|nr:DNA-directed RNA polymerase, mitochondrial [Tetranychus urticae]
MLRLLFRRNLIESKVVTRFVRQFSSQETNAIPKKQVSTPSNDLEDNLLFEKIESIEKTFNNVIEDIDGIDQNLTHSSELNDEEEGELLSSLKEMAATYVEKKLPTKRKGDKSLAENHLRTTLKSYLFACINANMIEQAQKSFTFYRFKFKSDKNFNPVDLSIYNLMIRGWAAKGDIKQIKHLVKSMRHYGIIPDMNTYAGILLGLINQDNIDLIELNNLLRTIEATGYKLENLITESSLTLTERKKIEDKFHQLLPSVKFVKSKSTTHYPCDLLKDFDKLNRTNYEVIPDEYKQSIKPWYLEQLSHERRGKVLIKSVFIDKSIKSDKNRSAWENCTHEWREVVHTGFQEKLKILKTRLQFEHGINIVPYLSAMKIDDYVDIIMDSFFDFLRYNSGYSPPINFLCRDIGKRFANKYYGFLKTLYYAEWLDYYKDLLDYYQDSSKLGKYKPRDYINHLIERDGGNISPDFSDFHLTDSLLNSIGRFFFDIIISEIKFDSKFISPKSKVRTKLPVFFTIYGNNESHTQEEIRVNKIFRAFYQTFETDEIAFQTSLLPMLVPPTPWVSIQNGGYLLSESDFIRPVGSDEDSSISLDLASRHNILPIFDSLNALSMVAWKINTKILDILIELFRECGDLSLDIPLHDSKMPTLPSFVEARTNQERFLIVQKRGRIKQEKAEMYSLWCECLYKLSIANFLRDRIFWFPYNIDFRGRVYTCPPHLTHLGNDISRSILLFAKGKPLGPKGLDWLKIHLINLTGLKKRETIETRLEYCNEIFDEIEDSADNPLTGRRWWSKQDDPWQVLACCMEIVAASRSPDPINFISHFPVHQDGSCNGLQHYAALGRDLKGAISVNLAASVKPNDVYSDVAELVEQERISDAAQGNVIAQALQGKIKRKVIKQTVMTFVYGVTAFGAKHQIHKQLKEIDDFPEDLRWKASIYLTKKTFKSIATMFEATQEIQNWFTRCAKLVSKNLGLPMEWRTPLGFPVVQPYFASKASQKELDLIFRKKFIPNMIKQRNAFPPNFIHSLDSSHMMLTALECERLGLNFAAIHDSYWTHPCNIDVMNVVCRQKFIALHSVDILGDLSKFMVARYTPQIEKIASNPEIASDVLNLFKAVPAKGTFDLTQVQSSVFFFS